MGKTLFDKIWDKHVGRNGHRRSDAIVYRQALLPRSNQSAGFSGYAQPEFEISASGKDFLYSRPQYPYAQSGQTY